MSSLSSSSTLSCFSGRSILITGGSSGIGLALAVLLASQGCRVAIFARDEAKLKLAEKTVASSAAHSESVFIISGDVSIESDVEAAVAAVLKRFGRLDYCFNNAGIFLGGSTIAETPIEQWEKLASINMKGAFLVLKHASRAILSSSEASKTIGCIVNTGSTIGQPAHAGFMKGNALVAASKAFINALTEVSAMENAGKLRINAILPGLTKSSLFGPATPEQLDEMARPLTLIGRAASCEEVAAVAEFLLSDKASAITGSLYQVDGGFQLA